MPKSPERSIRPQQIHKNSIKFTKNSHKIKTNLQWVEKNWRSRIKIILSGYKSRISYEFPKNRGKILENFRKPKNQKNIYQQSKINLNNTQKTKKDT